MSIKDEGHKCKDCIGFDESKCPNCTFRRIATAAHNAACDKLIKRCSDVKNPRIVKRGWDSQDVDLNANNEGTLGIHWLRFSGGIEDQQAVTDFLDLWFGEHEKQDFGYWVYNRSYIWEKHRIALNYHEPENLKPGEVPHGMNAKSREKFTVEIPGSALDELSFSDLEMFLDGVNTFHITPGRMDVYFDDTERLITPRKLYGLIYDEDENGGCIKRDFSGFKTVNYHAKGGWKGRQYDEISFGARGSNGSGAYLRCYDKRIESKGKNKAVRWELELSGEKAHKAFTMLCEHAGNPDGFRKTIGTLVGGCIDFIERDSGDKNLARCERYEFWEKIIEKIGSAKIRIPHREITIERSKEWIATQTMNANRALKKALGDQAYYEFFLEMINDESKPLDKKYQNAIAEYRQEMANKEYTLREAKEFYKRHNIEVTFEGSEDNKPEIPKHGVQGRLGF